MRRLRPPVALLLLALVTAVCGGGCGAPRRIVREEGTLRIWGGDRIVGQYVSPTAYERYLRAQMAALAGRHEEAVDELRRALTSDGISPYLRTRLGEELLALGRLDEARDALEAALRFDPTFAEAHLDLGRIALRLGDTAAA